MFKVQPVFISEAAKKAFLEFFLPRINGFAEAHSAEWSHDMAWSIEDVDKVLSEFYFRNIKFPFSQTQLRLASSWIKERYVVFKRFSVEEIAVVISYTTRPEANAPEAKTLKEYIFYLAETLQKWEDCPVGFSKLNTYEVLDFIFGKIFENPPSVEDPPIASEEHPDPVPPSKEASKNIEENSEEEEENETDEIEEPELKIKPTKKVPPKKKEVKKPTKPFSPPKGPKLVEFIKALLIQCLEIDSVSENHRQTMVKFARSLEKETNAKKYFTQVVEKAIEVTKKDDEEVEYDVGAIVEFLIEETQ